VCNVGLCKTYFKKVFNRGGYSVDTDYVNVPIFPDFVDDFPDFSPISCKLDNLTSHNFHMVCIHLFNKRLIEDWDLSDESSIDLFIVLKKV